jgi:hypothetical protein
MFACGVLRGVLEPLIPSMLTLLSAAGVVVCAGWVGWSVGLCEVAASQAEREMISAAGAEWGQGALWAWVWVS